MPFLAQIYQSFKAARTSNQSLLPHPWLAASLSFTPMHRAPPIRPPLGAAGSVKLCKQLADLDTLGAELLLRPRYDALYAQNGSWCSLCADVHPGCGAAFESMPSSGPCACARPGARSPGDLASSGRPRQRASRGSAAGRRPGTPGERAAARRKLRHAPQAGIAAGGGPCSDVRVLGPWARITLTMAGPFEDHRQLRVQACACVQSCLACSHDRKFCSGSFKCGA